MPILSSFGGLAAIGRGARSGNPYTVKHSILTRPASETHFRRTFGSPTDGKKWTRSFWIRRTELYASRNLQFIAGKYSMTTSSQVNFGLTASDDNIGFAMAGVYKRITTTEIDQTSTFVHVTQAYDSTQADDADRYKTWYGSTLVGQTNLSTITLNATDEQNSALEMSLFGSNSGYYLAAYIAEYVFVDGTALDYSAFEEGGHPILPSVPAYGNNGCYLNFEDDTSATTLGYDVSGNGNHWTPYYFATTDQSTVVPT